MRPPCRKYTTGLSSYIIHPLTEMIQGDPVRVALTAADTAAHTQTGTPATLVRVRPKTVNKEEEDVGATHTKNV